MRMKTVPASRPYYWSSTSIKTVPASPYVSLPENIIEKRYWFVNLSVFLTLIKIFVLFDYILRRVNNDVDLDKMVSLRTQECFMYVDKCAHMQRCEV